jgi:hypothetical protein
VSDPRGDPPTYSIEYEIDGATYSGYMNCAAGADSMQAIKNAFTAINAHLERIGRGGRLTWLGSDDLGFVCDRSRSPVVTKS